MSRTLLVHHAGPAVSVQDTGRTGFLAYGLSQGGAADHLALAEGAALLGQSHEAAALEMAGFGGRFEASDDTRIAVTGAPMRAEIDGVRLAWNASHLLPKGAVLTIGAAQIGSYGYLHVGGGFQTPQRLRARSAHLAAGIGAPLSPGDRLALGPDPGMDTGTRLGLEPPPRLEGGTIRIVASLQTELFSPADLARFQDTSFRRDMRGNRMGVRLTHDGPGFAPPTGLNVLSEVILPGDIQITGDGTPFVLSCECQTTGGYPRIGSVLPSDLPRVVQAQPSATLRFSFVPLDEAVAIERAAADRRRALRAACRPLIRAPETIGDLLSYQLISGVTAGRDEAAAS